MSDIERAIMGEDPWAPETCAEALARWDAGDAVRTIEMGGLGPGYEQCIHVLAMELIRAVLAADIKLPPLPLETESLVYQEFKGLWDAACDPVIDRLNAINHFSGAQVGAATNLASIMLRWGWRAGLERCEEKDRLMLVSNRWPRATSDLAKRDVT